LNEINSKSNEKHDQKESTPEQPKAPQPASSNEKQKIKLQPSNEKSSIASIIGQNKGKI